jgi:hypothetical protein
MDPASLASSLVTAQTGALQQQIATRVLKMNIDAQAAVLQLLQPTPAVQADPGQGVGGALDISV